MKMHAVTSSQIREIGHDPETNTLAVRFNTGSLYHYAGVNAKQFDEFKGAKSIGSHFGKHFKKNEKHPYTRSPEKVVK